MSSFLFMQKCFSQSLVFQNIIAPIVGATSVQHIQEAVSALDITLSEEETKLLKLLMFHILKRDCFRLFLKT
ncbi:MAG: hypothetical protein J1D99_05460 [Campylobacter sp.]|nr:hypothetical protein [Campylobacter sp.]